MTVPETLEEAITFVKEKIFDIKDRSEDEIGSCVHHAGGMWMRNNWGFWKGDTALAKELMQLGLDHADDMSGLIITCAIRDLKGQDRDIPGIIMEYKNHWWKYAY